MTQAYCLIKFLSGFLRKHKKNVYKTFSKNLCILKIKDVNGFSHRQSRARTTSLPPLKKPRKQRVCGFLLISKGLNGASKFGVASSHGILRSFEYRKGQQRSTAHRNYKGGSVKKATMRETLTQEKVLSKRIIYDGEKTICPGAETTAMDKYGNRME